MSTEQQRAAPPAGEAAPGADAITLAVIEGALDATVREMREVLVRSARSPIIAIATDFSNAIFDGRGEQVAQGDDQPVHLGSMAVTVRSVMHAFGDDVHPGDVFYVNDPASGGGHLVDMAMFRPVFADGALIAWVGNRSHMSDVGGSVAGGFNPTATELYEEGLRIPPVKLSDRGVIRQDVHALILANLRTARAHRGDMAAQSGALEIAERRILALCDRFGAGIVGDAMRALLDRGEQLCAEVIADLPAGTYDGRSLVENPDGGDPLPIDCRLTLEDGRARVALTAPPQLKRYVNSYHGNTISAVYAGLLTVLPASVPHNGGSYRRFDVDLGPAGTIVNAIAPAPCSMSTATPFDNITEAVQEALAQAAPDRAVGAWAHFCGLTFSGVDSRSGEPFAFLSSMSGIGGAGSMWRQDGFSCCSPQCAGGGSRTGNVEEIELRVPLRVQRFELQPDSEGAGQWRGGFGVALDFEVVEARCTVGYVGEGTERAPTGRLGGKGAVSPFRRVIARADGAIEPLVPHSVTVLHRGDAILGTNPGGGGVGDPLLRDRAQLARDVADGLISAERATRVYGAQGAAA